MNEAHVCIDCEREFVLVSALQVQRWMTRTSRCPTCGFNAVLAAIGLPDKVYEHFKRRVRA